MSTASTTSTTSTALPQYPRTLDEAAHEYAEERLEEIKAAPALLSRQGLLLEIAFMRGAQWLQQQHIQRARELSAEQEVVTHA